MAIAESQDQLPQQSSGGGETESSSVRLPAKPILPAQTAGSPRELFEIGVMGNCHLFEAAYKIIWNPDGDRFYSRRI
jgi:hypothetical protein